MKWKNIFKSIRRVVSLTCFLQKFLIQENRKEFFHILFYVLSFLNIINNDLTPFYFFFHKLMGLNRKKYWISH